MLRRLVLFVGLLTAGSLASAAIAGAATYYVSPNGNDSGAGTSTTAAWKTVARVNRAHLAPGDRVLFQGGATFGDQALMPATSGAAGNPIVFGSYGAGQPNLARGIWFASKSYLTFDGLAVHPSTAGKTMGLEASASGSGSTHISIEHCAFTGLHIGIMSASENDASWEVRDNLIQHTGDSGVIVFGHDLSFDGNAILDTGEDSSISYGKHGVYAKGPKLSFVGNTIRDFSADGISLRYRDALVEGNTIADGPIGVAWFQTDSAAGTSTIADNQISGTTASGIYVSRSDAAGSTRESFVVSSNTVSAASGNDLDLEATSGSLTVTRNTLTGAARPVAALRTPGGSYEEHDNVFWSTAGPAQIDFDGTWRNLSGLLSASGQGSGDLSVDPQLIDGGATSASPAVGAATGQATPAPLAPPTDLVQLDSTATSVTLGWTAPADSRISGYSVTGPTGAVSKASGTTFTATGLACGTDGVYQIASVDSSGDTSSPVSVTASSAACADTTPPWVLITSPTSGQTVSPVTTVDVDASDASGIHDVTFWVDGTVACVDGTGPYTCTVALTAGAHTLLVRATDGAGKVGWMSVDVTVPATAPAARPDSVAPANRGARPALPPQPTWTRRPLSPASP